MPEYEKKSFRNRTIVRSGRIWESVVGYSRAVRIGKHVAVTGTIGMNEDGSYPETNGEQMRRALETVQAALELLDADIHDVIRTRIYVTDISKWEEIGRIHNEFFADVLPATTMVEISRLADDRALLEVEADAIVQE